MTLASWMVVLTQEMLDFIFRQSSSLGEVLIKGEESLYFYNNFLPPQTAKARLASFPLGSINPYRSWSTVYICPISKRALVPPMLDSILPIQIYSQNLSILFSWQISRVRMQVMILVREAISCELLLLNENKTLDFSEVPFDS